MFNLRNAINKNNLFILLIINTIIIFFLFLLLIGCNQIKKSTTIADSESLISEIQENNQSETIESKISSKIPTYTPLTTPEIEGLHVTGKTIDIDISNYRLKVTGLVENPLNLTFDEVKAMPSARVYGVLDCPGFFTDEGYWTGVEIKYLLEKARVKKPDAKSIYFSDYENSYTQKIDISLVDKEGFLVAYQFNDKEFLPVHGFPLRIVAKGEVGSVWVKWLGEIEIR